MQLFYSPNQQTAVRAPVLLRMPTVFVSVRHTLDAIFPAVIREDFRLSKINFYCLSKSKMFVYESFSLIWSTISFMCLSGTLYVEVLNRGGSIYDIDSVLLNRFPLHQFLCCDNNCHGKFLNKNSLVSYICK